YDNALAPQSHGVGPCSGGLLKSWMKSVPQSTRSTPGCPALGGSSRWASTSRHQPLPIRVHSIKGESQATISASKDHDADHLHFPPIHIDEGLFQGLIKAEDLRPPPASVMLCRTFSWYSGSTRDTSSSMVSATGGTRLSQA